MTGDSTVRVSPPNVDDTEAVAVCAEAVRNADRLAMLSCCTGTVPAFTVDTFRARPVDLLDSGVLLSRNICYLMQQAGQDLAPARTGRLMRMLVTGDRGAVFVNEILEDHHLVGVAVADPAHGSVYALTRDDDRRTAMAANDLRGLIGQSPVNYGGWMSTTDGPASTAGPAPAPRVTADDPRTDECCRASLESGELDYVAVYQDGRLTATGNVLRDPRLRRFLIRRTPAESETFYAHFGVPVASQVREIAMSVHGVIGRRIDHVSFDVERGAVCYRRVDERTYVVAVTLDQNLVSGCEDAVGALAARLAAD